LDEDGKSSIVSGMLRDITPRKIAERQAEQLSERLTTIQDEERQEIAQELHDSTAQHLAALGLNLMSVQGRVAEDPKASELCEEMERSLGEATRELRTFTYLLHPPRLQKDGLRRSVHRYVEGFARRTGLKIRLKTSRQIDGLPMSEQRALLRVVQEALGSVHRHASASKVSIALKFISGWVHVLVSDDGKGINGQFRNVHRAGVGIPGMTARLRRLGGDLKIQSRGTTVHGTLPARRKLDVMRAAPP
jgi:signal transduction histidine kinase